MKARSRLKPSENSSTRETTTLITPHAYAAHTATTTSFPDSRHTRQQRVLPITFNSRNYLAHIGTLFLGVFFGVLTLAIMNSVPPSRIENILFPRSYLPFQILLFVSVFFLSSFLWLNSRRGYLTALALQILVFLKLQRINISWELVLGILAFFVIIELLFSYLETHRHANFKQKSHTRHRRAST